MYDLGFALLLVAIALVVVWGFLRYKRTGSERRMQQMLAQAGVDPALAKRGDTEAIISEVRSRCRRCQTEDVCERWLAGEEQGDNDFCPNARVFEKLKQLT